MSMLHRTLPAVLATVALTVLGCAAPTPDDGVADSEGAVTSGTSTAKITGGTAAFDPSYGVITESVFFSAGGGAIMECHALVSGTKDQADACNHYPANYVAMTCLDQRNPSDAVTRPGQLTTRCTGSGRVGQAPYNIGDGTYGVFYVNKNDPTDRRTATVNVEQDRFFVGIDGQDYSGYKCNFNNNTPGYGPPENQITEIADALHVTVEVPFGLSDKVVGCATGFSIEGLSVFEIAAKDAQAKQDCSKPTAQLQGRDGWLTKEHIPNFDRTQLRYDATPLVQQHQHIIFVFQLNGVNHAYVFSNNNAPRPFCK